MWFLTIFFWVLFLAGIFLILIALLENKRGPSNVADTSNETAMQILKKRFASGEIDEPTFNRMKNEIEG